jgi:dTDP-4-amino-4,6-dideoxygalactose transaminase
MTTDHVDDIPMFRPSFVDSDFAALANQLETGMVARGSTARAFEDGLAHRVGADAALTTSSGTNASSLAFATLEIGAGDEVLTPSLTCLGVVNAIARTGATPVFVDIDPVTLTLDPHAAIAAVTDRTTAIVPVHYAGHPADLDAIGAIATEHGLSIVEDIAHGLGALHRGAPLGSSGNLGIFSFHGTKIITTGEGGALVGPRQLLDGARLDTNFGVTGDRHPTGFLEDAVEVPGLKAGMSDLQASLGINQLSRLDELLAARRSTAEFYSDRFGSNPAVRVPTEASWARSSWHVYTLRLNPALVAATAEQFIGAVRANGGAANHQFYPAHLTPLYAGGGSPLPVTEREAFLIVSLPVFPGITPEQLEREAIAVEATLQQFAR